MKIAVSSAHRYLVAMAEKDMVFYENGTLSTPKIKRMNPAVSPAAIVGSIPCGSPEEKEARVEEYLPLSVSFSAFLIRLRELGCMCYRPLAEYITEEMGLGQDGGAG